MRLAFPALFTAALLTTATSARAEPASDLRSPGAAAGIAAGAAIIGTGVTLAGIGDWDTAYVGLGILTVGPSLGHVYAGAPGRGLVSMALRGAGAIAFAEGVRSLDVEICGPDHDCSTEDEDEGNTSLIWLGAAVIVGTTLFDIAGSAGAAAEHNRRLQLTPTVLPSSSGPVGGMALAGTF
jgi:hypothetical protein